ncbi:hypothetical protein BDA96_04G172300 [Sorghum bicolor]|uniref:Uncharacterized protein n=2 Tax=Sorghum bicolor TaxID=4558 RepID=A0A921UIX7_SORBI|nr:hypothetical protein BDA96_04G172300 [Sorghum bicolor]OQU85029.1 hypothetical protein SORBI_3004G161301 [Sorghum bicolor]
MEIRSLLFSLASPSLKSVEIVRLRPLADQLDRLFPTTVPMSHLIRLQTTGSDDEVTMNIIICLMVFVTGPLPWSSKGRSGVWLCSFSGDADAMWTVLPANSVLHKNRPYGHCRPTSSDAGLNSQTCKSSRD